MPIPKLVLMLVCLMSFTLEPLEPKEASKEEPKEAEVTPLFSKDLADFPGYLSASNMFRKSAYRDDPETKKYGLWMHGIPMFYAGPAKTNLQISWDRRLADAREPGWRAYLLKKVELAVDTGVDGIIWDNMIGYNDGLAQLLDDTQRMAEGKARETGRPKVMVMPISIFRRTALG